MKDILVLSCLFMRNRLVVAPNPFPTTSPPPPELLKQ
jgi:hypothetical protein